MTPAQLRSHLDQLEISQSDLAKLLGVTPRAVSMWLSEERAIPGPVQSYIRLLCSLPRAQRAAELARLGAKWGTLEDGLYRMIYSNHEGKSGQATLVFEGGRIYGTDLGNSVYDGSYILDPASGAVEICLRVEIQPGENSVSGISQPFPWLIEGQFQVAPRTRSAAVTVSTNVGGDLEATMEFIRPIPQH